MAAVNFPITPCEPYTAHKVQGKHCFSIFNYPCVKDVAYARIESFRTFLYAFMKVFERHELWVNEAVAIFFLNEDSVAIII